MKRSRLPRRFLGLDLTDPYARSPRAIDVAIVDLAGRCTFAQLPAFSSRADESRLPGSRSAATGAAEKWIAPISGGPDSGDILVIDGPLALASRGQSMRAAERILAAAGKTPDHFEDDVSPSSPARPKPFAGLVRGSIELASALRAAGWKPSFTRAPRLDRYPPEVTMFEAYPGAAWTALAGGRLPKKSAAEGRVARARLLRDHGLRFTERAATHDQLDAALCAWLGWTLLHQPARILFVGPPCFSDNEGELREGGILQPAGSTGEGTR